MDNLIINHIKRKILGIKIEAYLVCLMRNIKKKGIIVWHLFEEIVEDLLVVARILIKNQNIFSIIDFVEENIFAQVVRDCSVGDF